MRSVELRLNVLDEEHSVHTDTDKGTDKQSDTQTDRQSDRQTHRQSDRQTARQIRRSMVLLIAIGVHCLVSVNMCEHHIVDQSVCVSTSQCVLY